MPRATYNDLVAQVVAQIDIDDTLAHAWLIDRSRLLNAEAAWNVATDEIAATTDSYAYALGSDVLFVEAVLVGPAGMATPYQRATMHQLDARHSGQTENRSPIYAENPEPFAPGAVFEIQLDPNPTDATRIEVRYVAELPDGLINPPFPADFDSSLVDGAIALGLARMDERMDSAGYFEQRFLGAIPRLRRRRHGRIGRGAVSIRVGF